MRPAARTLLIRAAMPRIFLALTLLVAARASAVEVGLSGPSVESGDVDAALAAARAVEATGTTWARLNFRLAFGAINPKTDCNFRHGSNRLLEPRVQALCRGRV